MKIKNFQKNQDFSSENKINRADLQALLVTDGSVLPKYNMVSFANTSETLIKRFCDLTERVYGCKIPKSRIGLGKGRKQKLYLVQFRSKEIAGDLLKDMTYNTTRNVSIPAGWFEFDKEDISRILRSLFDADGGCSLRVSFIDKKKCFEIERTVFLSCNNAKLRKQYRGLISKLGISTGESSGKVTITKREEIENFRNLVNFSENVLVGFDSKHWQGLEKRKLLDFIINSYAIPRGRMQKFRGKKEIYEFLTSFQVNTVTEK